MVERPASHSTARYSLGLTIFYKPKGIPAAKAGSGRTVSLSEGGACLELGEPLPTATPLNLILPTDAGSLTVEAEVVWLNKPSLANGRFLHGVTFSQVSPDQRQALKGLIHRRGQGRQPAARVPLTLPARCRPTEPAGTVLIGWTWDVSREGLSLLLPERLPVSAAVEITLATQRGDISAEARVVWVESGDRILPGKLIRHGMLYVAASWVRDLVLGLALGEGPKKST